METRSESFLKNRSKAPLATAKMAQSVSQYRQDQIASEIAHGLYREGNAPTSIYSQTGEQSTGAGNITYTTMKKTAQVSGAAGASGAGTFRGAGGTVRQVPEIYSPLWLTSNLNLPRDRATINAWCRSYFTLNPVVRNALTLHASYPISKLSINCKDRKKQQFFDDMNEALGLMNVCVQMALEYFLLGETVVYADLDESTAKWSRLLIQNPDYISIEHSTIADEPRISLRPDENLKRIVTSNRPEDILQRRKLNKSIIDHVRKGENIPLSNFNTSYIANKISPYDLRGTGLPVSCFRQLMLYDMLRESKFAQAANLINPITVVKIGNETTKPTPADLESWREIFESAQYDKDFKIFTHEGVAIERVGASGGIIDTGADITQLLKEIYMGLLVPQVLMDGGSDVTYANGGVTLDVLKQRYMQFRNMMAYWLRKRIFAPISKINEFYEYVDGEKILIVPEVEWNHMSLFDTDVYISTLSTLATGENRDVSIQTLFKSLGLNWEDEQRKKKEESISREIEKKEMAALETMSLDDLRALTPDQEIREPIDQPVPGEALPGEGEGGGDAGLGMPDLGGLGGEMGGGELPEMPAELPTA